MEVNTQLYMQNSFMSYSYAGAAPRQFEPSSAKEIQISLESNQDHSAGFSNPLAYPFTVAHKRWRGQPMNRTGSICQDQRSETDRLYEVRRHGTKA